MAVALLFGAFAALLLMGVPVGVALGVASMLAMLALPFLNLDFFVQGLVSGLDAFPLLAVLLFTLAGNLMSRGGLSRRLLRLAEVFLGRSIGGLGIVTIVACIFFASISGTGSATVAAVGVTMIPAMLRRGYDRGFAVAAVATSGGIGVIIPPSVVMIVYAVTAEVSVTDMFLAGIIPGLFIGLMLMAYCLAQAYRHGYRGSERRFSGAEKWRAVVDARWALLIPFIILGGIYSGLFTPTESAAIAVIYGLVFGVFVYREITLRGLFALTLESTLLVGTVLVIVGTSVAFGRILSIERIPTAIAAFILSLTDHAVLILLAINLLLLMVGTFMETLAAIVILTPILLPVVTAMGMHPAHFGIVMVVNLAIGFVTPPLGANLFMASQIGQLSLEKLSRAMPGWILVMLLALLVITFVPALSLALLD